MMDSKEESKEPEAELQELGPVALLKSLKKKSNVDANETEVQVSSPSAAFLLESLKKKSNVNSNETEIQASSPFAVEAGINHVVARAPSPIETGTDRVFLAGEEVDSDSRGPTEVLKQIRKERAREYEEHILAKVQTRRFVSRLPVMITKSKGNLKTEGQVQKKTISRTIVYSSDINGITQDEDHVSLENIPQIRKIMTEALVYLNALNKLKPAFGKNSDCCVC
jgi:hypothetical protein